MYCLNPFLEQGEHEPVISEVFENWKLGQGIFDKIMSAAEMPWKDDTNVTAFLLDIEYFGNRSGAKFCSPLVKYYIDENGVIPNLSREILAKVIVAKYLTPWSRLWLTNEVAYSPINNYDMTETRNLKRSDTEGELEAGTEHHTGTDTLQHGKTETTTHGKTDEEMTYRYGLNSSDEPPPSDKFTNTEGGTTAVADTGSDVDTKNLTDTSLVNRSKAGAGEEEETTHRIGNIGVTTNQKLISEERNLWIWNFFDQVFRDIDRELTLAIFDPCRV